MNNRIDPNAPAYPNKDQLGYGPEGLTIRQCYAKAAMQGFAANPAVVQPLAQLALADSSQLFKKLSQMAWEQADAMIQFENEEKK